jgi:DNA mismatch repair protein MutS2
MVAATTHYAELKSFATDHPLVSNASVEFDVGTLRPTYRLAIGLPGKSQAFAIAERLGLPGPILADARERISSEHASMEETLAAIARAEAAQAEALEAAQRDRAAATEERERARAGTREARRQAGEVLAEARRSADAMIARAEREVAELRRDVARQRSSTGEQAAGARAAEAYDELRRRAARARTEASRQPAPADEEPDEVLGDAPQPRAGLWGRSRTLGTTGRIVEVSGRTGRVTLETEGARLVIPSDDVEVVPEPIAGPAPRDVEAEELRRRAAARVSPTLTLRGERVEAALEQLEAYLDEALLAGLDSVRIVHGSGTGALRRAVREALAEHPRVQGVRTGRRDEGGDGATIAEL